MKNRIFTIIKREIKNSFKRFLSLVVLSLLGVATFVGISKAKPDMLKSIDSYFDNSNLYDIKILSSLGLTNRQKEIIDSINGVSNSYLINSNDYLINNDNIDYVSKFIALDKNVNKVELIDGKLPSNKNEIAVEKIMLDNLNLKINDYIKIDDENILKITGVVKSPLFILNSKTSKSKGNTNLGTGVIDYYCYVIPDFFNSEYYTELYVILNGTLNKLTDSKRYNKLVKNVKDKINISKKNIEESRYKEIYDKAELEINNKENEGLLKFEENKIKLDNYKNELDKAKKELDSVNYNLNNYKNQLEDYNNNLMLNKNKLIDSKNELKLYEKKLNESKLQIDEALKTYNLTYEIIKDNSDIENYLINILKQNYINKINLSPYDNKELLVNRFNEIINNFDNYYETDNISLEFYNDLLDIKKLSLNIEQLKNSYNEYILKINMYNEFNKSFSIATDNYNDQKNKYNSKMSMYNNSIREYYDNLSVYNSRVKEFNEQKLLFDEEINKARLELEKIEKCKLYIYDRKDDSSYSIYIDDANNVSNLAKVFPTIFFIVAILISLISMTRMVQDDRMLIGTLKSLGYGNKHIRIKYILYSLSATLIGGFIGALLGFYILPKIIFDIYQIIFNITVFKYDYDFTIIIIGLLISICCIVGSTILTTNSMIKEKTAILLRPKSPKDGKRIFIEKIKIIWNRISFSNKIVIRNLVRYKKRVIMMIVGIVGCTGLLLTGFGIRDAIIDVGNIQYNDIFHFDDIIYLKNDVSNSYSILPDKVKNYANVYMNSGYKINNYTLNLFVPEDDSYKNVVNIKDVKTKKELKIKDNEIIITDKLSSLTNKKKGDFLTIIDSENNKYHFRIGGICENYVAFYVYMNKKTYENNISNYKTNTIYVNIKENVNEKLFIKDLLKNENVISASSINENVKSLDNMLKSLNKVVLILIILSGSLTVVVLYNLSYINIIERKREVATLKVLGFTNKEVDNYINKETIILTFVGILIGLIFGKLLTKVIIKTVELDQIRFIHKINLTSYIFSALFIMLITIIVTIIIHFYLKKIDMVESLKSVE